MSLQTFKSQLKAKLKTLGVKNLSNERIDAYAATLHKRNPDLKDEDTKEHDEKIDELHEVVDFKKVATEDDRVRTLETKLKEKEKSTSTKKPSEEDDDEDDDDDSDEPAPEKGKGEQKKKSGDRTPKWAKTLMEEVQSLKKEKQVATIKDKIKAHEKMKDIPEDFYEDYVQPDKEEDIEAFAEKVSTKYGNYKQVQNNTKAAGNTKPVSSAADTKGQADMKEVDKILDNIMPGTKAPEPAK
jgi:hypothetical protein